jgi:hypothetical protein
MQAVIRRKLMMAADALQFALAHPSTDAGFVAVVAKLQDSVTRGDALAMQQRDGTDAERAAIARRNALRRDIQQQQLRHLVRVAQTATSDHPELDGLFKYPENGGPLAGFISAAKSLLTAAGSQKDLFVTLGLGETFIDNLTQEVAQFDTVSDSSHTNRQNHVGARADLAKVAGTCIKLVSVIDGLNRARFAADPEMLAAWQSASRVSGGRRSRAAVPPEPAPVPEPVPPIPVGPVPTDKAA